MKTSFEESEIREVVRKATNQIKRKFKPIVIIQFGSSLYSKNMMIESDADLMVILRRRVKYPIETFLFDNIEVEAHLVSKRDFIKSIKNGFPLTLMAVRFGRVIYGPRDFLEKYKNKALPTRKTIEIWYDNAWRVFHFAILDYISRGCVGCYLKDCHHAARSFLRAFILKARSIVCEKDEEILSNVPKNIQRAYKTLIEIRKNGEIFPFKLKLKFEASFLFKDEEARPLLLLEKIAKFVVKEMEGKEMKSLREIVKGLKGEVLSMSVERNGKVVILKDGKFIERSLFRK
jgi:predicted nucleotidyltransferase